MDEIQPSSRTGSEAALESSRVEPTTNLEPMNEESEIQKTNL